MDYEIIEKDGIYKCDFRYKEVRIRRSADSKAMLVKDVERRMREIDMKINDPVKYNETYSRETFEDVYNSYAAIKNWSDGTRRNNDGILKIHFKKLRNKRINEITMKDLQNLYVETMNGYKNGEHAGSHTNKVIRLMIKVMEFAIGSHLRPDNLNLTMFSYVANPNAKTEKTSEKLILKDDFDLLISEIFKMDAKFFRYIDKDLFLTMTIFLYYTGVRIGEARAVRCKDIVLSDTKKYYCVNITKQLDDRTNEEKDSLKNGLDYRFAPIDKTVYEYLMGYIDRRGLKPDDYLFKFLNNMPLTRKSYSNLLKKVVIELKAAGNLPEDFNENVSPHTMRYSCSRMLHDRGIPIPEVAKFLGHTNEVQANIYLKFSKQKVEEYFSVDR